mmetsp:Transcript_9395/g.12266  ORF Transcript_9395/g.12266 Transcript_9395/m.12266 type:complete len:613 (+) Transcript_9395:36-1874(+)
MFGQGSLSGNNIFDQVDLSTVLGRKNRKRTLAVEDSNCVQYRLYLDCFFDLSQQEVVEAQEEYQKCLSHCNEIVRPFTDGYLWQVEPFKLEICTSSQEHGNKLMFLEGSSIIGENVMDEWFLVFLLKRISEKVDAVTVTLNDNDGEFLLIEAAEYLPEWINPVTAVDRVFLKSGKLRIIPLSLLPEASAMHPQTGDVKKSLKIVSAHQEDCLPSEELQRSVWERMVDPQPSLAYSENRQFLCCLLPSKVAHLLEAKPELITHAARAFLYRDDRDVKAISRMDKVDISSDPSIRLSRVQFTRCSYAQLNSQPFLATKPFDVWIENCGDVSLKTSFSSLKAKTFLASKEPSQYVYSLTDEEKGLHMGMKLCCGIEILCTNPIWSSKTISTLGVDNPASAKPKQQKDSAEDIKGTFYFNEYILRELSSARLMTENLIDRNLYKKNDDDSWIKIEKENMENGNMFEGMFNSVQQFINKESGLEGVSAEDGLDEYDDFKEETFIDEDISFDVEKFMSLLSGTGFESDLTDADSSSKSQRQEEDSKINVKDVMDVNDEELLKYPKVGSGLGANLDNLDHTVVQNLIESFEAEYGHPGPATTMFNELGLTKGHMKGSNS